MFLMLVGLTALLIGGLGVSGAVRAWLLSRMNVIATLKCLGVLEIDFPYLYFASYGDCQHRRNGRHRSSRAVAFSGAKFLRLMSMFTDDRYLYKALLLAAGFGLLTTCVFAVWPLSRTRHIRAAHLFRALMQIPGGTPSIAALVTVTGGIVALAGLAVIATGNIILSLSFMIAALVSMGLLYMLAGSVLFFCAWWHRPDMCRPPCPIGCHARDRPCNR